MLTSNKTTPCVCSRGEKLCRFFHGKPKAGLQTALGVRGQSLTGDGGFRLLSKIPFIAQMRWVSPELLDIGRLCVLNSYFNSGYNTFCIFHYILIHGYQSTSLTKPFTFTHNPSKLLKLPFYLSDQPISELIVPY